MRRWFTAVCVVVIGSVSTIGCGPTQPATPEKVTLTSVRYVRTRAVVAPEKLVGLNYSIPNPEDPLRRPRMGGVGLRSVDGVTFVYDFPTHSAFQSI